MRDKQASIVFAPPLIVLLLAATALLLRLQGAATEGAWHNAYADMPFLTAPSLPTFLQQIRTQDPAALPLYFALQYYWYQWVSTSVFGLRLLDISLGVLAIPFVYALGARLYGRRAGYVAALCLAVSPAHTYYVHAMSEHTLLILLATASFWSLLRLLQRGKPSGWRAHGVAAMLLYWTHPAALLVPIAQGCWLLLHRRLYRAPLPGWLVMHAMLAFPAVSYLLTVGARPSGNADHGLPSRLGGLFLHDISVIHQHLLPTGNGAFFAVSLFTGYGITIVLAVACLAYWLPKMHARGLDRRMLCHTRLVLCWLVVPPLTLVLLSLVWRPCIFPCYTVHGVIAVYLLLGGAVQGVLNNR